MSQPWAERYKIHILKTQSKLPSCNESLQMMGTVTEVVKRNPGLLKKNKKGRSKKNWTNIEGEGLYLRVENEKHIVLLRKSFCNKIPSCNDDGALKPLDAIKIIKNLVNSNVMLI